MKRNIVALLATLALGLCVPAFAQLPGIYVAPSTAAPAKDNWQVGNFRKTRSLHAAVIQKVLDAGDHIKKGTVSYTCIGGDAHSAPYCASDLTLAQVMNSGRVIAFADGTSYACEDEGVGVSGCPDWFLTVGVVMFGNDGTSHDGTFLYKIDEKGVMHTKALAGLDDDPKHQFPAPVLDGKVHDLRKPNW